MGRLDRINNWDELAERVHWSAAKLAKHCVVSLRTLERHFIRRMKKTPRLWLIEQRMERAKELLAEGATIKETAVTLSYKHATHFSRDYRRCFGGPPNKASTFFAVQEDRKAA